MLVAIAFSSSVNFARLVEPIVTVWVEVTLARLFKIVTKSLSSNFVDAEMLKETFIPVIRMDFKEEQPLNIEFIFVTLLTSNAGTLVNFEQL